MKKLIRKFPQAILIVLALFFIGVIAFAFSWGIGDVVGQVNRALNTKPPGNSQANFDIAGAQKLNLRGLVSQ
jgi:amino acid transporter